jgi:hypothetical protein
MTKTPDVRQTLSETGGIKPRGKGRSKTREGKLAITWQAPAVRKQFQMLAVEQEVRSRICSLKRLTCCSPSLESPRSRRDGERTVALRDQISRSSSSRSHSVTSALNSSVVERFQKPSLKIPLNGIGLNGERTAFELVGGSDGQERSNFANCSRSDSGGILGCPSGGGLSGPHRVSIRSKSGDLVGVGGSVISFSRMLKRISLVVEANDTSRFQSRGAPRLWTERELFVARQAQCHSSLTVESA